MKIMNKTKVQFNLHKALGRLQEKNNRSYNASDIESTLESVFGELRVTRQTVHRFMRPSSSVRAVSDDTLAALIDFFAIEGMPIGVGDLFTVTDSPDD